MAKKTATVMIIASCVILAGAAVMYVSDSGMMTKMPDIEYLPYEESSVRPVYCNLDVKEKALYYALLRGIEQEQETIALPFDVKGKEYAKVYRILEKQEGSFFYLDSVYYVGKRVRDAKIAYRGTGDNSLKRKQLEEAVQDAVEGARELRGDYYMVSYINNYIINNCEYTEGIGEDYSSTAYGCLVEGKANCEGYAKAFNLLASKMGLKSVLITGTTNANENHAWNQVCVGLDWYNIDVTWSDTDIYGEVRREYFLRPDFDFLDTHNPDDELFEPYVCYKDDWNYYKKNGLYATTVAEAESIVKRELGAGNNSIEIKFSSNDIYDKFKTIMSNEERVLSIIDSSGSSLSGSVSVSFKENRAERRLTVTFSGS
ncbi:transglutaminase domain-containing protein [Ruminococcus sp.]|uniref:transglutaminase domain-containing protein n=1 Tax=Ruminococcus sp. TaxID=41978 RepID=UPI001B53D66C|nr:transglutaminase domain-containing protein [Ruminococcus sp.]MBP5433251.1 hypothetical protein [Ruminococcus sp.]